MRIMGVDPGTLFTGFGVIECEGNKMSLVEYGVIRMKPSWSMPLRLEKIHRDLLEVIERSLPDEFAIESAFYAKNVQSTLKLGHARGAAILAAVLREIPTSEYAPREIKKAVTGTGGATKEQVEYMVTKLLNMKEQNELLDATDALAIAICHAGKINSPRSRSRSWKQFVQDNPGKIAK
jgi:crossover junction endodeoxyribonuclease RuvC